MSPACYVWRCSFTCLSLYLNRNGLNDSTQFNPDRVIFNNPPAPRETPGCLYGTCLSGRTHISRSGFKAFERFIYRIAQVNHAEEMDWKTYAIAMLAFNFIGLLFLYLLLRLQNLLPLNPQDLPAVPPDLAFNTAVSFVTNTNWQSYSGETTMSYLTQMVGLAVQNFLSAATGMAVLIALIRGFVRHSANTIGNFWVDMTRSVLYILITSVFVLALVLVSQGVVQTFSGSTECIATCNRYQDANGQTVTEQTMATWPGRLADRHQAARHQWRRIFQCQLGPSLRKSHPALQLPGNAGDPAYSGSAVLYLRQDGGRYAQRLGDTGSYDHYLCGDAVC